MASRKTSGLHWWFILGFVIVLVGVLIWISRGAPQTETYNGFEVSESRCIGAQERTCAFVQFTVHNQTYQMSFYHPPREVEDIGVAPQVLNAVFTMQRVPGAQVQIGVPEAAPGQIGVAGVEFGRLLGQRYGIFNFEVTNQYIGEGNTRTSCADANNQTLVITVEQGAINAVTLPQPNCISLIATSADESIRVADAFSYALLGVTRKVK